MDCLICERPCEDEDEPYLVAMRNGRYVDACWSCWMRWPDDHKLFPPTGFGRPADLSVRNPDDLVDVLREPA